jgi:hypothetical protein
MPQLSRFKFTAINALSYVKSDTMWPILPRGGSVPTFVPLHHVLANYTMAIKALSTGHPCFFVYHSSCRYASTKFKSSFLCHQWTIHLRNRHRQDIFLFSETSRPSPGLTQSFIQWVPGVSSGVKVTCELGWPLAPVRCLYDLKAL